MAVLGRLLRKRRAGEAHAAWSLPNLSGPETLRLTSPHFEDGGPMPREDAARHVGGRNVSPPLAWTPPPAGAAVLLLVVEDLDVPVRRPFVHCMAVLDPLGLDSPGALPAGALSRRSPAAGVRLLRSGMGRGYIGPGPIKGHGPHRYVFQLFALDAPLQAPPGTPLERARPRAVLAAVSAQVLARGRLTGVFER